MAALKKTEIGFQEQLSLNAGEKYCRMHKQIPKKPFNILSAVIVLSIDLLKYFFGIYMCSKLIPLLQVSNLLQNGHFPIFSLFWRPF